MRRPASFKYVAALAILILTGSLQAQTVRLTRQAGTDKPLVPGHFSMLCGTNEVLAGVYGRAKDWVDRIGGYCVRVTSSGAWDGELRATNAFGGSGGNDFDSKCARGEAVSAFSGRHGLYIDRMRIRCRKLASPTSLTGSGYYKSYFGGTAGSAFGPYTCPNDKPAAGFGGQANLFVDALFFMCRP